MGDYGRPYINRIDGMPGKFRLWTDDTDQKTSRIVTRNQLTLLKLRIDEALKADAAQSGQGEQHG